MTAQTLKPLFRSLCLLTACCAGLTFATASAAADEVIVHLKDGRKVSGEIDARTNDKHLWLRATAPTILLRSSFAWDNVRSAKHAGKTLTAAEFQTLAKTLKTKVDLKRYQQPRQKIVAVPNGSIPH
jgi:hypothetical protein